MSIINEPIIEKKKDQSYELSKSTKAPDSESNSSVKTKSKKGTFEEIT